MAQKYIPVALRRSVRERADERCEYCLIPEWMAAVSHWVDHITAEKYGGRTTEANLALSCVSCNQHKGTDLASLDPLTELLTPLFHPRNDTWIEHFRLAGGTIQPLTPIGRVTVRLLQLNAPERIEERRLLERLDSSED